LFIALIVFCHRSRPKVYYGLLVFIIS
jgi:hypothetical protein